MTHSGFDWLRNIQEIFALAFSVLNIGEEIVKSSFRHQFSIVEIDSDGIFDRRIMKGKLRWKNVDWIDPHPAGMPDRLRIKGAVDLTTFGKVRNLFIRVIRRIPKGEVVITFGGLSKAAAQATTWIADHKAGLVADAWKSAEWPRGLSSPTAHDEVLISAKVCPREWTGLIFSGVFVAALFAGLLPALMMSADNSRDLVNLPIWLTFSIGMIVATSLWFCVAGLMFWIHAKQGDQLIVISQTGFSDARISTQFIGWQHVESVSFQYRDMGRLINEAAPITIQFREGFTPSMPDSKCFWPPEILRRIATPELRMLKHHGTTTSVSEIIEILQRHHVPVAIRETSRG